MPFGRDSFGARQLWENIKHKHMNEHILCCIVFGQQVFQISLLCFISLLLICLQRIMMKRRSMYVDPQVSSQDLLLCVYPPTWSWDSQQKRAFSVRLMETYWPCVTFLIFTYYLFDNNIWSRPSLSMTLFKTQLSSHQVSYHLTNIDFTSNKNIKMFILQILSCDNFKCVSITVGSENNLNFYCWQHIEFKCND